MKCIGGLFQVASQQFLLGRVIFTDIFLISIIFVTFRVLFLWFPTSLPLLLEIRMSFWQISLRDCFQNMKWGSSLLCLNLNTDTPLLDHTKAPAVAGLVWLVGGVPFTRLEGDFTQVVALFYIAGSLPQSFWCTGSRALRMVSDVAHPCSAPRTAGRVHELWEHWEQQHLWQRFVSAGVMSRDKDDAIGCVC